MPICLLWSTHLRTAVVNQILKRKYLLQLIKKKRKENQKFIKGLCHENTIQILTNEKHWPKTMS